MKLWIIYKKGMIISKVIADVIQDRLEDYVDVLVGTSNNVKPEFLMEEELDYLIIGDIIRDTMPSKDIKNWVQKFGKISKKHNRCLKALSGFYISLIDIKEENNWRMFLQENINAEIFYPPIIRIYLKGEQLSLEIKAFEIINCFCNDFIDFLINNNIK